MNGGLSMYRVLAFHEQRLDCEGEPFSSLKGLLPSLDKEVHYLIETHVIVTNDRLCFCESFIRPN